MPTLRSTAAIILAGLLALGLSTACGPAGPKPGPAASGGNSGAPGANANGAQPDGTPPAPPPLEKAKAAVVAFLSAMSTNRKAEAAKWVMGSEREWFNAAIVASDHNPMSGARFEVGPPEAAGNGHARVPVMMLMGETVLDEAHYYECRVDADNRWRVKLRDDSAPTPRDPAAARPTVTDAQWNTIRASANRLVEALGFWFLRNPEWGTLGTGEHPLAAVLAALEADAGEYNLAPFTAADVMVVLQPDGHFVVRVHSSRPDGPLGRYELNDLFEESGPE